MIRSVELRICPADLRDLAAESKLAVCISLFASALGGTPRSSLATGSYYLTTRQKAGSEVAVPDS